MPAETNNKTPKKESFLSRIVPIPVSEKIFFLQNLGVMVKAGISLSQALKTLALQSHNQRFSRVLTEVQEKVETGQALGEVVSAYPKVFNELFVNMVKAGEVSGRLEESLKELYTQMKKDHALVSKIKSAMTYPVIIIIAMIGIGSLMIVFVIPKITSLFDDINAELPISTKILIALSDFTLNYIVFIGIGLVALVAGFFWAIKQKTGKKIFHSFLLKLPIVSRIIKKINLARFARTLSSLIKTDIPIIQTFQITSRVVGNVFYQEALHTMAERIKKGEAIEESLKAYPKLFPPVVVQMVAVGEQTGSIDTILAELANFYEEEVNQTMSNLPTIIEPILLLILGAAVAGMSVAVIMPMYSLSQQM